MKIRTNVKAGTVSLKVDVTVKTAGECTPCHAFSRRIFLKGPKNSLYSCPHSSEAPRTGGRQAMKVKTSVKAGTAPEDVPRPHPPGGTIVL